MIINLSVLFVILIACLFYERKEKYYAMRCIEKGERFKTSAVPWVIIFGYIAFLAAMRTNANDTSVYISSFRMLPASWEAFWNQISTARLGEDWAFDAVSILFKTLISDNYHLWLAMYAVVEALAFVYMLRRNAVSILDCCYFFFCSTLYYNNFSMMRQWFAVTMIFAASHFMAEKKFWKYVLVCLIVGQFHSSALLMIPIYFIANGKAWSKKQNLLIIVFVACMVFLNPILNGLEETLSGTTYDYAISAMAAGTGSSIIRALISIVPVALAYIYRTDTENTIIDLCINMSLLNFLLNLLAAFTSGLYIIRFATYTSIYNMILYPYLLNVALPGSNKKLFRVLFYVIYIVLYFYQMNYQGAFYYGSDVLGVFL